MRIGDVVKALKDRQKAMEEAVFKKEECSEVDFAKARGRWLGLGEAITVIAEQMRKEHNED